MGRFGRVIRLLGGRRSRLPFSRVNERRGGTAVPGKLFYGWINLAIAGLLSFFHVGAVLFSFGVFLPHVSEEFGWSRGMVSGAYTMLFLGAGLSYPLAGWFVKVYGARLAIVLGNLLVILGLFLLFLHTTIWQFYVAYGLLVGLGHGFGQMIPALTLASDWFTRRRSLAMGIILAASGIGGMCFVPAISVAIETVGWRYTYLMLVAPIFVFAILVPALAVINKPEEIGQVPDGGESLDHTTPVRSGSHLMINKPSASLMFHEALRTKNFWLLMVYAVSVSFSTTLLIVHIVSFLVDAGFSPNTAAFAFGLVPGIAVAGKLTIGFLGCRFSMRIMAIVSTILMLVASGLLVSVTSISLPVIFAATALMGLSTGAVLVASLDLFASYFGPLDFPRILGFVAAFGSILGSTGPVVAGFLYDAMGNYELPFAIIILLLIIGIVCLMLAKPTIHARERQA